LAFIYAEKQISGTYITGHPLEHCKIAQREGIDIMPQHTGEHSMHVKKKSLNSISHKRTTHYHNMMNCVATSYSWQH